MNNFRLYENTDVIDGYLYYQKHQKLTKQIMESCNRSNHLDKFILVTDKGFSPVFYTIKNCMYFLANNKYSKYMKDKELDNFECNVRSRLRGNIKATTPLPLKYTKGIPIYVIALSDKEYKHFVSNGEYSWFMNLRDKIKSKAYS